MLFCEGCINGPKIPAPASAVARKEALIDWIHEHNRYTVRKELAESLAAFDRLDLSRKFDREAVVLPQPTEEEIAETLKQMRKFTPEDQLNCGSCGYPSCREKAIAVRQGFAEVDMCLPVHGGGAGGHGGAPAALGPGAGDHAGPARADRAPRLDGADLRGGGARDQQPALARYCCTRTCC